MKERFRSFAWWLCLLPLVLFLSPQRLPFMVWSKEGYDLPPIASFQCDPLSLLPLAKEEVPEQFADLLFHPWIKKQIGLSLIVPEMVRDVESIARFCALYPDCDATDLTNRLMETLETVQAEIPLHFSPDLYNVLWIAERPSVSPFPFRVVQRLYLGESRYGLPLYLDIRRFETDHCEAVIAWHQAQVVAEFTPFGPGVVAIGEAKMPGPGLQIGKRALYLQWEEKNGMLYLAYANLAIEDWERVASYQLSKVFPNISPPILNRL